MEDKDTTVLKWKASCPWVYDTLKGASRGIALSPELDMESGIIKARETTMYFAVSWVCTYSKVQNTKLEARYSGCVGVEMADITYCHKGHGSPGIAPLHGER